MLNDQELLWRVKSKKGEQFERLWNGDLRLNQNDQSQADMSLCYMLAFCCGPDPDRVDRLFCQSNLFRSKWDERHTSDGSTYGQRTIQEAINKHKYFDDGIHY